MQRNDQGFSKFVAIEGLACAVRFNHGQLAQLNPFKSGKASAASRALPPTSDGRIVLGRAAVLYGRINISAERATHALSVSFNCKSGTDRRGPGRQRGLQLQQQHCRLRH